MSSNPITYTVDSVTGFYSDSKRLLNPRIVIACAIGFAIMGFIGFFVKLVFIPINNILLGSTQPAPQ